MLKKLFTYILLLQLTVYTISTTIIWVSYYILKDYIIEAYCENKETPMCGGKCHMMKVEKESPKDKDIPKIEVRTPEVYPFLISELFSDSKSIKETLFVFIIKNEDEFAGFCQTILKPPQYKFLS